jgi:hypothetical protein
MKRKREKTGKKREKQAESKAFRPAVADSSLRNIFLRSRKHFYVL